MKTNRFLTGLFVMLLISTTASANPIEEGKSIFMTRCAACHNVNQKLTGPALAGVNERRSIDWIINFVHSSQTMVKKGDPQAVALFEQFNKIPMPDHPDLTEDNIKQIVEYIKSEAKPVETNTAPFAKPRVQKSNAVPLSMKNAGFFIAYLFVVGALIGTLLIAVKMKSLERERRERNVEL